MGQLSTKKSKAGCSYRHSCPLNALGMHRVGLQAVRGNGGSQGWENLGRGASEGAVVQIKETFHFSPPSLPRLPVMHRSGAGQGLMPRGNVILDKESLILTDRHSPY